MKTVETHWTDRDGQTQVVPGPSVTVDLTPIVEHYLAMGKKYKAITDNFVSSWQNGWEQQLFNPKAVLRIVDQETVANVFKGAISYKDQDVKFTLLAVWTIGVDLEHQSAQIMSQKSGFISGFLLDVAGSAALYDTHVALLSWAERTAAAKYGLHVSEELYPCSADMPQALMEEVTSVGDTQNTIGVKAGCASMLLPRKTQCAFFGIGPNELTKPVSVRPCVPCTGKRCLYCQLGGCHMEILKRKSAACPKPAEA